MVLTTRLSGLLAAAAAAALVAVAAPASAQVPGPAPDPETQPIRAGRPFRGIFGGGLGDTEQSLTVNASAGGGYDYGFVPVFEELQSAAGHSLAIGSAGMTYSLSRDRAGISVSAEESAFYYPSSGADLIQSRRASASQRLEITERLSVSAGQYISHQPFRLDRFFPGASDFSFGAPSGLPVDTFAGSSPYADMGMSLDVSQEISRRVSLSGGYSYSTSEWSENRHTMQGGRVGLGITAGRGLSVRLGYGQYRGRFPGVDAHVVRHHAIDAGVDYSGSLSLSRRTSLSFSTGSTAISDREETYFRVIGRAQMDREIGRSWRLALAYSRDVHFADRLGDVLYGDSVTFSVGGLINRRLSFRSGVGATLGGVGFQSGDRDTRAMFATAGIDTALGRLAAVGVDYTYYFHSFGTDIVLPNAILREIDRHSIRAYISVWAPLLTRVRSQSNASR